MFDLDRWTEIYQALAKNPLQTFLTALGVFWGILMLVIMLGAGNGLHNGVMRGMEGDVTNSMFIWTQSTSKPYMGFSAGRRFSMDLEDFKALKLQLPNAKHVAPRIQLGGFQEGYSVKRGDKVGNFNILGDYPVIQEIEALKVNEGRFLNKADLDEGRKVAVIGIRVKDLLFEEDEDPIGKTIQLRGVFFTIVGVFGSKRGGDRGFRDSERIYVPFTSFRRAFNYGNRVGWFILTAKADANAIKLEEQALNILRERHKVHPEDDRAFGHFNLAEEFKKVQGLFTGIKLFGWFVGILTLFAGMVGVTNIMLVVVKERTKEIGIRRAIGAKPWNILTQIMLESISLTALAGYFGLLIGIGLLELLAVAIEGNDDLMIANPTVDIWVALQALLVLMFAGALAGFLPATRALSIAPVDALRAD